MSYPIVRLLPQMHKRVARGHPWIYSNEIQMDSAAKARDVGALVTFAQHDGTILGVGSFNARSLIAGRVWTRAAISTIDQTWFEDRLRQALAWRERLGVGSFCRLVHAEADGLPGLVIDRFGAHFAIQVNTAGMDRLVDTIVQSLKVVFQPTSITLKNDSPVRAMEGLSLETSVVFGDAPDCVPVQENGLTYWADIKAGQKTGWYFDQRDSHALVASYAQNKTVLDLYTHAGGFALMASSQGATYVTGVDSSQPALELAEQARQTNHLKNIEWVKADVFDDLENRIQQKNTYDIVIADPPAFVKSKKDIVSGGRGYRKLAKLSAQVTAAGGMLYIASCSYNMDLDDFTAHVAAGLHDAGRGGRIVHTVFASPDHPVHPHMPESSYLKGLFIQLS